MSDMTEAIKSLSPWEQDREREAARIVYPYFLLFKKALEKAIPIVMTNEGSDALTGAYDALSDSRVENWLTTCDESGLVYPPDLDSSVVSVLKDCLDCKIQSATKAKILNALSILNERIK